MTPKGEKLVEALIIVYLDALEQWRRAGEEGDEHAANLYVAAADAISDAYPQVIREVQKFAELSAAVQ